MKSKVICFLDAKGDIILERKLTSLPILEKVIISKSVEFYNDWEPCMIHRSAVIKRLYMEIDIFLENTLPNGIGQLAWEFVPDSLKSYINVTEISTVVSIKEK